MDEHVTDGGDESRARVLARMTAATAEDPFGPGDPLEAARLVRRTLAAAGCKAIDVMGLIIVGDAPVPADAAGRFARRALGLHGASVACLVVSVALDRPHEERIDVGLDAGPIRGGAWVVLVVGPDDTSTAVCAAAAGSGRRSEGGCA